MKSEPISEAPERTDAVVQPRSVSADTLLTIERAVLSSTGEDIAVIRDRSIEDTRRVAEEKHRAPFRILSYFPFIGRGNVLRDRLVSHEQVEASLDEVLGKK